MKSVKIPASKSYAHRLLIYAALSDKPVNISCDGLSDDILATISCLNSLGADITIEDGEEASLLKVTPVKKGQPGQEEVALQCGESGSTLRFMIPVCGALGAKAVFHMKGRLPKRPLHPFDTELMEHGMTIRQEDDLLHVEGMLTAGEYSLPGNISSQYISGLLMALPFLDGDSSLEITDKIESLDYIIMTEEAFRMGGGSFDKDGNSYKIPSGQHLEMPEEMEVEGDWSNAAFFLCMGAMLEEGIEVRGLNNKSFQGDMRVLDVLKGFGAVIEDGDKGIIVRRGQLKGQTIDAAMIPDLVPVLSVVASVSEGDTEIINGARLRLKESDRIKTTVEMIKSLGGSIEELEEGMIIHGRNRLAGGTADAFGDHRIAMASAIAGTMCDGAVEVIGPECVKKSYPRFWEDLRKVKEMC